MEEIMIEEVVTDNAFTTEKQPDGNDVLVLDPYTGCQLQCPYCFQFNDPDWGEKISVNLGINKILARKINDITGKNIYIGSKCDPYMPLEQQYHLTRQCLEVLSKCNSRAFITTKSDNQLILEDLELLKSFVTPPTVLLGLSNMNQVGKGNDHVNIKVANELKAQGLDVWCFITPIIPYIMNIDGMLEALDKSIPVFFDKIRVMNKGHQDEKILKWVDMNYPQYHNAYKKILFEHDTGYYKEAYEKYHGNPRFKFMTDEWGV